MNHHFVRTHRFQTYLNQRTAQRCLVIVLGAMTVACSQTAQQSFQPSAPADSAASEVAKPAPVEATLSAAASSNTTEADIPRRDVAQVEVGDDGEPNEPLTVTIERLALQPGTPYSEVRSHVRAVGWQPYTQAEGAVPDVATRTVRDMHALGFPEAQSCSGTGQGFCAFEFVHINRPAFPDARLVIVTTPDAGTSPSEPNFYRWRIDGYDPATSNLSRGERSNFAFLEANATYENQPLSAALYAEVLEQEQNCLLVGDCANAQYLFKDALLTISPGEFGAITMAVTPHTAVARTQALSYAQILDVDREIELTDSVMADNYEGGERPVEGVRVSENFFTKIPPTEDDASTKMVRLISSPNENISRIEFEIVVF